MSTGIALSVRQRERPIVADERDGVSLLAEHPDVREAFAQSRLELLRA
jgi:hypothetical protein